MAQLELNKKLSLNNNEINLFARQLILDNFGEKKQKKIIDAHITFIGMGGINCPALIYLLAAGIRNVTIVDNDKIQQSNLNRQIIYSINDVGKYKINCIKKYIKQNFKKISLKAYNKKLNINNCSKLINKTNIVIDGTDNWETMKIINDYCVKNNTPLLSASVSGYDGNFLLLKNEKGKHLCLRCIFPYKNKLNLPRCEIVGIMGTSAGIIGLLAAHEVINFITSVKKKYNKKTITFFEGESLSLKNIKIKKNNSCSLYKK